jgi:hypothetical protein
MDCMILMFVMNGNPMRHPCRLIEQRYGRRDRQSKYRYPLLDCK